MRKEKHLGNTYRKGMQMIGGYRKTKVQGLKKKATESLGE